MCSESGAIAFWDAQADTRGIRILNGASGTVGSSYIPIFRSEMEIVPPLIFTDAEHTAYAIIEDGIDGKSYLNIQLVDLILKSSQTICSTAWFREDECILSMLCTQDMCEIYLLTGTPAEDAPDGFYDMIHLLCLDLYPDGSSELNELLHFDHQSYHSVLNYISPLSAVLYE